MRLPEFASDMCAVQANMLNSLHNVTQLHGPTSITEAGNIMCREHNLPWGDPFAGFDVSSGHVKGANTDCILIVHGQKISTHKESLYKHAVLSGKHVNKMVLEWALNAACCCHRFRHGDGLP